MDAIAEIASAFVTLLPSARGFGSKLDGQISGDVTKSGKKQGLSFGKLFAAGAALGLGAKAFSFLGDSLAEARDAQVIGARTENVIKKMGDAANISATGVGNLAEAISKKTGIDDEAIQSTSNVLLTFRNLRNETGKGNDVFNRATKAVTNMSVALGKDAKGSAIQVGKALNDPLKGIAALGRAGVQFSEVQKAQIAGFVKSGNTMKAQKVILGELTKQFGGAATAMATPADNARVAFDNLKEQIGTAVLPVVDSLTNTFTNKVVPAISGFVTQMQTGVGAGGQFVSAFMLVGSVLGIVAGFITKNADILGPLVVILGTVVAAVKIWTAAQVALNFVLTANPIGLIVVAIGALVVGLVIAYKRSETFRAIVNATFTAIKTVVIGSVKAVRVAVTSAWNAISQATRSSWNAIKAATGAAWNLIKNTILLPIRVVLATLRGDTASATSIMNGAWSVIKNATSAAWAAIKNAVVSALRGVIDFIKGIPGKVTAVFAGAPTLLYNAGVQLMTGLAKGISDKIEDAVNAVKNGLSRIKGLLPGSPIKWGPLKGWNNGGAGKRLMGLVSDGIKKATPKTIKAAKTAFGKIGEALTAERDALSSTLDGLKGDFQSLADSVSGAFTGNLFEATTASDFIANLTGKKGQLQGLLASFKTLVGFGLDPAFLSQLFASGNGGLITELAGLGQAGAVEAGALFGEVTSLSNQLGNAVAKNDPVSARIDETNRLLGQVNEQLSFLGGDIGKQLNNSASKAQRDKHGKRGKGK